jgi:hypothetical protein
MGEQYMRSLNGDWPGDADRERRKVKDLLAACKAIKHELDMKASWDKVGGAYQLITAAIKRAEEG